MSGYAPAPAYHNGAEMWQDCCCRFGQAEAIGICRRYLDLKICTARQDELQFCREPYSAMQAAEVMGGNLHE